MRRALQWRQATLPAEQLLPAAAQTAAPKHRHTPQVLHEDWSLSAMVQAQVQVRTQMLQLLLLETRC